MSDGSDVVLMLIAATFFVALAVCWIVLPFAIIGTKDLLRELIREQRRTNELLEGRARPAAATAPRIEPVAHWPEATSGPSIPD